MTWRKLVVCLVVATAAALWSLVSTSCDDGPPPAPDAHVCGIGTPWLCDAGPDGAP